MAETRYAYTLAVRNEGQLDAEIRAKSITLATLLGVAGGGANVQAVFPNPLAAPDKTALDAVIAAHVPAAATTASRLEGLVLPVRVSAALCVRNSTQWAGLTAAQKTAVQNIIDAAAANVIANV